MFLMAACGTGSTSTPSPTTNQQAAALAFAQCMRAHGVNIPDSITTTTGGSTSGEIQIPIGVDKATAQAATQACQKYLPQIGGNGNATPDPARLAAALAFSQCMRAHGITSFPDPQTSGGKIVMGGAGGGVSDFNPSSVQFQTALKACQSTLAGVQGGGGVLVNGGGAPSP